MGCGNRRYNRRLQINDYMLQIIKYRISIYNPEFFVKIYQQKRLPGRATKNPYVEAPIKKNPCRNF